MKSPSRSCSGKVSATTLLCALFLFCSNSFLGAQGTYVVSGTTVKVNPGTVVTETTNLLLENGSTLDNQGTFTLKGNLNNQNPTQSNLGTGTFQLTGASQQTISGQNLFTNLTVNNAAGIVIAGNTQVNGTLTLTSGLVTLGSNNLLLGPSATVAGSPSASAMVVATGTGEMRKEFAASQTFTFPVGDNTSTAEYSPVALAFGAGGTFNSGNYAGVNLVDDKYHDPNITGDYLTRYWNLSSTGISGFTCDATFSYIGGPSDVSGTEGNIYCVKIAPSPATTYSVANTVTHQLTASGLTAFSSFTGAHGVATTSLIAFLEGPYSGGAMTTTLNTSGKLPLGQPYSGAPWNYSGTESVGSIPAGVVDWILIDLRQAGTPANATSATSVAKRAAFIKSDGTIVDLDGTSGVRFYNATITSNLYPVIFHRNHLSIMANNAVTLTNGMFSYNFSTSQTQIYDGTGNGCKQLGSLWGMVAGNGDGTTLINNNDLFLWQSNFSLTNYNPSDHDLSGIVNNNDLFIWQYNFSAQSKVPN